MNSYEQMREALDKAHRVLHCAIVSGILKGEDAVAAMQLTGSALALPQRNCDFGTMQEQYKRYRDTTKDVYHTLTAENVLKWAQKPIGRSGK